MAARLTGIAAAALASYVLGLALGLDRFMILFAVAVVFGALAVWTASHIPRRPAGFPTAICCACCATAIFCSTWPGWGF
jgi:hypothetical protein